MRAAARSLHGRTVAVARSRIEVPQADADAADLVYVSDAKPGIRRRRAGKAFRYVGPDGRPVRDAKTLARIRGPAIPPAYSDVWISLDPRGHLQATGRDARGRKQYRYHARWREVRDRTKFDRMLALSRALPAVRARVARDLAKPGLPKEKVLGAIVRLLESTCVRVGNEEYARDNGSYGLTTLRDDHVVIRRDNMVFEFRGKRGRQHRCRIQDRALIRIVSRCQSIPGEELFQYVDGDGVRHAVDSGDVNAYLREAAGEEFSAKDLRTWAGTLLVARALSRARRMQRAGSRRCQLVAAIDEVAEQLHNTRAVCRKYYVHPAVIDAFEAGELSGVRSRRRTPRAPHTLSADERALIALLRRRRNPRPAPRPSPRRSRGVLGKAPRRARRGASRRRSGGR